MRSTVRQISVALLLAVLLAPGLLQARTPARHSMHMAHTSRTARAAAAAGFFSSVWNLLGNGWLKTGGQMDPLGSPSPGTSSSTTTGTDTGDTGGQMDPVGTP